MSTKPLRCAWSAVVNYLKLLVVRGLSGDFDAYWDTERTSLDEYDEFGRFSF